MVIEPVGTRKGDGEGGGGYSIPLIVLRLILIVDRVGEVTEFDVCIFVANRLGVVTETPVVRVNEVMVFDVCMFVANRLGAVIETPAVTLDVTKVFILPDKELKLKHPMLLAVIIPLDMKDVDIVLMVAY